MSELPAAAWGKLPDFYDLVASSGYFDVGWYRALPPDAGASDLDLWAYVNDVTLDFSRSGKPADNGYIEGFNSKLRAECLNSHWFMSLADARENLED